MLSFLLRSIEHRILSRLSYQIDEQIQPTLKRLELLAMAREEEVKDTYHAVQRLTEIHDEIEKQAIVNNQISRKLFAAVEQLRKRGLLD